MHEVFTFEQGSPEWFECRRGIPTASEFKTVMAKGQGKVRKTYMLKLADEIISGEPMQSYTNVHMDRGKEMEAAARADYAFDCAEPVTQVGFIRNEIAGGSPDSLVGEVGMLEIKTALPHLLAEYKLKDQFPPEHKAQCQGNLWVAEREWIDISINWPNRPPFVKRASRDNAYIDNLADEVERFAEELSAMVETLKQKDAA